MTNCGSEVPAFCHPRMVVKQIHSKEKSEGDGAIMRRSIIGGPELKNLDPFLLLDYGSVSPPAGFPDHPHRGFETVTYMLQGAFADQDFAGHKGTIRAGDLQWMTVGRGIVHSEMPATRGTNEVLQLWVNLSAANKMIEPSYQELQEKDVVKVEKDGLRVSVIAGDCLGIKSPIYTRTPTMYLDVIMQPGAVFHQPIPEGWNAFAYILEGTPTFGTVITPAISAHHTVQLGPGDGISMWNKSDSVSRFVLIGGQPLNEPVVQHGPFVMNTWEEIKQAIYDFQHAQNGFEKAASWRSDPVTYA
ncbi:hypothetical protein O6H91_04G007300 [Diphasiastrum complanatum]|uniref:Uncharacterized protein n=2 Tax=Diphasiastrum complanatum TaxID=34168 RepID=A0ACC2DU25_DIPCM|nr:hypothetical protein O6H91_04G006900 [Diphasiastrum complanatum]KAJ7557731.1 hypothetical protein O6H91_04G007300 [Diphasiastrum complanatum]